VNELRLREDLRARAGWAVPSSLTPISDADRVLSPEEYAERRVRDPRTKRVDEDWRLSQDGQWFWKCDTSSDEMVGQMLVTFDPADPENFGWHGCARFSPGCLTKNRMSPSSGLTNLNLRVHYWH
jgi:hypothetical protein